jgi:hypothetical protein
VCTIQLDGYPGVIRLRPSTSGVLHQLKLRECGPLTPTDVIVDLGRYEISERFFHGALRITGELEDPAQFFVAAKSRKMTPMVS